MVAALRQRDRLGDRVVEDRLAARLDVAQQPRQLFPVGGPSLDEHRLVAEAVDEDFILGAEQVDQKSAERTLRGAHLLAGHGPGRVEGEAEAHGHAFVAEVEDGLRDPVFVDHEVVAGEVADEPPVRIRHRRRDAHHFDAGPEAGLLILLRHQDGGGDEDERGNRDAREATGGQTRCPHTTSVHHARL